MVKKTIFIGLYIFMFSIVCNVGTIYAAEQSNETALRRLIKSVIFDYLDPLTESQSKEEPMGAKFSNTSIVVSKENYERVSKQSLVFDMTENNKKLPGVVSAGDFDARLYVRGGRSEELLTLVDGQMIKSPYLWNGKISFVNPKLIEEVNFYSGSVPAKYPNALSGVLDVYQRKGDMQKYTLELDQNLSEIQFLFDGPIQHGKHSFLFSARKTYYDYLFRVPNTILPHIDSFSQKFLFNISKDHRLFVDMKYVSDLMVVENLELNQGTKGTHAYGSIRKMIIGKLDSSWSESLDASISFGYEDTFSSWKIEKDQPSPNTSAGIAYDSKPVYLNVDFDLKEAESHKVQTGFSFRQENISYEEENINMLTNIEYPSSVRITNSENYKSSYQVCGIYYQDVFDYDLFSIEAGLRYSWIPSLSKSKSLQPRISVSLKNNKNRLSLFASFGKYEMFNNPIFNGDLIDVSPERVMQYSVGLKQQVDPTWQWKTEVFVKKYSSLVSAVQDSATGAIVSYENSKLGRVHGWEFTIKKEGEKDWSAWMSYTYSKAKYYENGVGWYWADHDQRHTFNLSGTYKLTDAWSVNSSLSVSSGKPFTDVIAANYDSTRNVYVPVKAAKNAERLPGYSNLTISIEYNQPIWPFNNFEGSTYIGATNLLNHPNVYGYSWSDDYSIKTGVKMLPFVPIFGVKIIF